MLEQHGPMERLVAVSLMHCQFIVVNFANQIRWDLVKILAFREWMSLHCLGKTKMAYHAVKLTGQGNI